MSASIKKSKGDSTPRVVSSMFLAQAKDTSGFEDGGRGHLRLLYFTFSYMYFLLPLSIITVIIYNICCISVEINISVGKCC